MQDAPVATRNPLELAAQAGAIAAQGILERAGVPAQSIIVLVREKRDGPNNAAISVHGALEGNSAVARELEHHAASLARAALRETPPPNAAAECEAADAA